MLDNCLQEPSIEAMSELGYCANVIVGSSHFTPQMFKFGNVLIKRVALHLDF